MKRATRQKPSNDGAVMLARSPRATQLAGHRLPALDGLRGIGIAAVVVYHLDPSWLPGGYLGVDIFFVVSGFLITWLLFELLGAGGPVGPALRQFWARRARRLLPALVTVILCVTLFASFFARDAIPLLRADIPAALGFVANWQLLFHHDSYFESMGRPPLLLHLWSLGVEEQFYLVWPFVVLAVLRLARRPERAMTLVAGAGAAFSAFLMAAFFVPGHDPSSVYYDTFTHSSGLMIGAALAGAVHNRLGLVRSTHPGEMPPRAPGAGPRAWTGVVSLAGLATLLVFTGANTPFAYRGGIFLASALTGLALLVSLQPGIVQKALGSPPLRYLGKRSYSLYLWHWPIICLTRPEVDVPISGWPLLILRLTLVGLAAEASYKLVEQPFRTGRAQAALRSLSGAGRTAAVSSVGLCGVTAVVLLAVVNPPPLPAALLIGSTPAARATLLPAGQGPDQGLTGRLAGSLTSRTTSTRRPTPMRRPTSAGPATSTHPATSTRPATTSPAPTTVAATTVVATTVPQTTTVPKPMTRLTLTLPSTWVTRTDLPAVTRAVNRTALLPMIWNGILPMLKKPPTTTTSTSALSTSALSTSALSTSALSTPALKTSVPAGEANLSHHAAKVPPTRPKLGHDVLAIGDSVLVAATTSLEQRLHGDITVDAVVGRQVWSGIARLAAYKAAGDLVGLKAIVIDLGTNGPMTPQDVAQFRALSVGVPLLVFVNVRVPLPWQSETNASLAAVAGQPGIAVVNWYSASAAPGVLWPDAIHPGPKGQVLYANLVAAALAQQPQLPMAPASHATLRPRLLQNG
jgi:peptidoglycan/LPS O-acetylase OafA/YrhL